MALCRRKNWANGVARRKNAQNLLEGRRKISLKVERGDI